MSAPPTQISPKAFAAAACLMTDYFAPMAERVFGDAGATEQDRNAATVARWVIEKKPAEVYVRINGDDRVLCAKLHPDNSFPCPFLCHFPGHRHMLPPHAQDIRPLAHGTDTL